MGIRYSGRIYSIFYSRALAHWKKFNGGIFPLRQKGAAINGCSLQCRHPSLSVARQLVDFQPFLQRKILATSVEGEIGTIGGRAKGGQFASWLQPSAALILYSCKSTQLWVSSWFSGRYILLGSTMLKTPQIIFYAAFFNGVKCWNIKHSYAIKAIKNAFYF